MTDDYVWQPMEVTYETPELQHLMDTSCLEIDFAAICAALGIPAEELGIEPLENQ